MGLLAVDQRLFGLDLRWRQWVAVAMIIVLQCYLVVTTDAKPAQASGAGTTNDRTSTRRDPMASGNASPQEEAGAAGPSPGRLSPTAAHNRQTPCLVLDVAVVPARYRQLRLALPGVAVHYAVKANPEPRVLEALVAQGCRFDVASPAEVTACLRAGAVGADLSYGNTAKKERDIAWAFERGVRVFAFDDDCELDKLHRAAPGSTVMCRLATSGRGADWQLSDKFGCAPGVATNMLLRAATLGHEVGIAFHVGSQQREPTQWEGPLRTTGEIQRQLAAQGLCLSTVDIGGGFPGSYRDPTPPISAYGTAIMASITRNLARPLPSVMCEPGRFLVADAGVIETEVVLVARREGLRWVYLDIGLFGGLAEALDEAITYRIGWPGDRGPCGPVVIAGPTCDSVDVLYREAGYRLPLDLRPGDKLHLSSAGAYTATYASVGFNGIPPLRVYCLPAKSEQEQQRAPGGITSPLAGWTARRREGQGRGAAMVDRATGHRGDSRFHPWSAPGGGDPDAARTGMTGMTGCARLLQRLRPRGNDHQPPRGGQPWTSSSPSAAHAATAHPTSSPVWVVAGHNRWLWLPCPSR